MPARTSKKTSKATVTKTAKTAKTTKKSPAKKTAKAAEATGTAAALLTAGKIALALKVPDAKVKKAIAALGLAPAEKRGVCNYYGADAVPRIKKALAL